jgi:hypothetical protein
MVAQAISIKYIYGPRAKHFAHVSYKDIYLVGFNNDNEKGDGKN